MLYITYVVGHSAESKLLCFPTGSIHFWSPQLVFAFGRMYKNQSMRHQPTMLNSYLASLMCKDMKYNVVCADSYL